MYYLGLPEFFQHPMRGKYWSKSTNAREANNEDGFGKHFQFEAPHIFATKAV
jgi:hypothetical protein